MEASGESPGPGHAFFGWLDLPDSRALGAGLPGPPGSWSIELLPPSRSGCMRLSLPLLFVTPFAILVFAWQKFQLHGCKWCLRLLILGGRSSLGRSPCSVSLFGPFSFKPSNYMERRLWSLAPFFPFCFSFGVTVTQRIMERELEWDFPSGCSFSLRGCIASVLAVAGNGCRVLQACPFFRMVTVPCSLSRFFSFPLALPGVVTTLRVCLPQALALRRVLEAMLAEGALESPSVLVLAFQSSLPSGEVL